jgi:hypothetical protein
MTEKWCPAGKMECGNSIIEHFCKNKSMWRVEDNANCPFPDNQQSIEPKAVEPLPPTFGLECQWHKEPCKVHKAGAGNGHCYSCGRADGMRECMNALKKIKPMCNIASPLILKDEAINIIAALEGVKGE